MSRGESKKKLMSQVLSYNNKTTKTAAGDWIAVAPYVDDDIRRIHDPNGGLSVNPRTAIPSPFAGLDLVKNAFERLAGNPRLDGTLMDKRKFCDSSDELEDLRKQIADTMDKRAKLRSQRRTLNEKFHTTLHDIKAKYNAGRKARYTELETKQREFRQARIDIAKKYAALHEEVRKVIAIRKAEERAEAE